MDQPSTGGEAATAGWRRGVGSAAVLSLAIATLSVVGSAVGSAAGSCVAPVADLRVWYPFDGEGVDELGSNDGLAYGTSTYATGHVSDALSLTGDNTGFQTPDADALDFGTGDLSIQGWINTSDTAIGSIVDKRSASDVGYHVYISSGSIAVQLSGTNYQSVHGVADGSWHHFAITVDRDSATGGLIYVDGSVVLTFNPTSQSDSLSTAADLYVGKHKSVVTSGFDGLIDEIQLFDRVLTSGEITAIHGAGVDGVCKQPVVTISAPIDGAFFAVAQVVTADFACTDGAGLSTCVGTVADGAPIDTGSAGSASFTVTATDSIGRVTAETHSYVVDGTPPSLTLTTPPDVAVYRLGEAVTAGFVCTDAESGVASCTGTVADGAPIDTTTEGVESFTVSGADAVGNSASTTHTYTVDGTAPSVVLTSPADGSIVVLGASVVADFECTDSVGIATCVGTVDDGLAADTSSDGAHSFTVTAADAAGNMAATSHTYTVDGVAPTVVIATPANGVAYAVGAPITIDFDCNDLHGISSCVGSADDGTPLDTSTAGSASFTVTGIDSVGNTTVVTRTYSVVAPSAPSPTTTSTPVTAPPDRDRDGQADSFDNCPDVANGDQLDSDGDSRGDACDGDDDGDGLSDEDDECPMGPGGGDGILELQTVSAGASVSTDHSCDGATAAVPIEVHLTTPVAGEIAVSQAAAESDDGFEIIGYGLATVAPLASADEPLIVTFTIDATAAPEISLGEIDVLRNGDRVRTCEDPSTAEPDPCVANRRLTESGDFELTVLTSAASVWQVGVVLEAAAPPVSVPATNSTSTTSTTSVADVAVAAVDDRPAGVAGDALPIAVASSIIVLIGLSFAVGGVRRRRRGW